MYWHNAIKQPGAPQFQQAMLDKVQQQVVNGNFSIIRRAEVPEGETIFPAVWQMKRKRRITTREISKWKA
jgi:hypothetical protein